MTSSRKIRCYVFESTWECGELELVFPHPPEDK